MPVEMIHKTPRQGSHLVMHTPCWLFTSLRAHTATTGEQHHPILGMLGLSSSETHGEKVSGQESGETATETGLLH